jgi:hypothetical protein
MSHIDGNRIPEWSTPNGEKERVHFEDTVYFFDDACATGFDTVGIHDGANVVG